MFCVCTIISTLNSSGNLWLYHWLECSLQPMWRAGRSHWVTSWRPQIWCDYIVSSNHRGPIILSHQQWTMIKRSIFFAMAGIWEITTDGWNSDSELGAMLLHWSLSWSTRSHLADFSHQPHHYFHQMSIKEVTALPNPADLYKSSWSLMFSDLNITHPLPQGSRVHENGRRIKEPSTRQQFWRSMFIYTTGCIILTTPDSDHTTSDSMYNPGLIDPEIILVVSSGMEIIYTDLHHHQQLYHGPLKIWATSHEKIKNLGKETNLHQKKDSLRNVLFQP